MQSFSEELEQSGSAESMSISDESDSCSHTSHSVCEDCGESSCGCSEESDYDAKPKIPLHDKILNAINQNNVALVRKIFVNSVSDLRPSAKVKILSALVDKYLEIENNQPKIGYAFPKNYKAYCNAMNAWDEKSDEHDKLYIAMPSGWILYHSFPIFRDNDDEYDDSIVNIDVNSDTELYTQLEKIRHSPCRDFYKHQLQMSSRQFSPEDTQKLHLIKFCVLLMINLDEDKNDQFRGAAINGDSHGIVPFNQICAAGCVNLAEVFLASKLLDIETRDEEGNDAIQTAILGKQYAILDLLTEKLDPKNKALLTGQVKTRKLIADALDVNMDLAPPPDRKDFDRNSAGESQYNEAFSHFVYELSMFEIIDDLADSDNSECRKHDTEQEGKTYLHIAIDTADPLIVLKVLNRFYAHLSLLDEHFGQRCIDYINKLITHRHGEKHLKAMENIRARINTCFRNKKISVNIKQSLIEVLQTLHTDDLYHLQEISTWNLFDVPLLHGMFHNICRNNTEKNMSDLREALATVISTRTPDNDPSANTTQLFTQLILIFLSIQSAHQLDENANYSSGGELDETLEDKLQAARDQQLYSVILHKAKTNEPKIFTRESVVKSCNPVFVPVFRGINFKRDIFLSNDANHYEENAQTITTFPSHSSFTLINKRPFEVDTPPEQLDAATQKIEAIMKVLRDASTLDIFEKYPQLLRGCSSLRMLIQRIYTEDIDGFNYHLFNKICGDENSDSFAEIEQLIMQRYPELKTILNENPFASGSAITNHGVRYALGMSRAFANTDLLLQPQYNKHGKPKHPCVGLVFVALYPIEEYLSSDAIYVPQAWVDGDITKLKNHIALLPEAEITFPGSMKNIVKAFSIFYPSFEPHLRAKVMEQFKLTDARYNTIAAGINAKRGSPKYVESLGILREHLNEFYNDLIASWLKQEAKRQNIELRYQMPAPRGQISFSDLPPTPDEVTKEAEFHKMDGTCKATSKEFIKATTQGSERFRQKRTTGPMDNFVTLNPKKKPAPHARQTSPSTHQKRSSQLIFEGIRHNCINVSGFQNNCGVYAFCLATSLALRNNAPDAYPLIPDEIRKISEQDVSGANGEARLLQLGKFLRNQLAEIMKADQEYSQLRQQSFIQCCVNYLESQNLPADMESFVKSNEIFFEQLLSDSQSAKEGIHIETINRRVIAQWPTLFARYLDYIKTQPVMLTADELGCIAKAWNIDLRVRTHNDTMNINRPKAQDQSSPLKIKLYNANNHWQVDTMVTATKQRKIADTTSNPQNKSNSPNI